MSRFYGYSHYAIARYEAEKHARAKALRDLDRQAGAAHHPSVKARPATDADTRKGLLLMIAAMVLPIMATAVVVLANGQ